MNKYVIFGFDTVSRKEIYVYTNQHLKSMLVEVTDELDEAKKFDTARRAYEWARMKNLDYWKVGLR